LPERQDVQLALAFQQVAQGGVQISQVFVFELPYVSTGQLADITHVKLVKKLIEHEVHRVSLVQLKQGDKQGEQILELFP
jgi:hypothetical protein